MACTEETWQTTAGQVCGDVQLRIFLGIVARDHVDAWKGAGEEGFEARIAIQHATVAGADHIRQESRVHNLVADALLAPDQKTPRCQVFALPKPLRIDSHRCDEIFRLPAPFKVAPARSEIPLKQLGQAQVIVRFRELRFKGHCTLMTCHTFIQLVLRLKHVTEVRMDVS